MPLAPGDSFDRYTIESLLGTGSTGHLYRAIDTKLKRRVALKILSAAAAGPGSDPEHAARAAHRLTREARAAAALDHPNAVAIFDVGEVDDTPFLAMELIEGKSLRAFIGDARISVEQRVRWLTDVARALSAAHERGLVHRDVKPENVMLRADGVVKVLDFGIARTDAATDGTLSGGGDALGAVGYASLEQVNGDVVDGRADQFSWGVVAYELLAGRMPWAGERDAARLVQAMLTRDPPPLEEVCPGIAESIAATVHKALARAPEDRFASMDEIVLALEPHGAPSIPKAALESTMPPPPGGFDPTLPSGGGLMAISRTHGEGASRLSLRRIAIAAVIALPLVAGAFLFARDRAPHLTPPALDAARAPRGVAITDAPLPRPARPDAATAYLAGLQALRDASIASGMQSLERAASLDSSLAAAHLRLAWWKESRAPAEARVHLQRATQLRASLSERDQALLAAVEPYASREPPDLAEATERMSDVVSHYANDAELTFYLGRYRQAQGDLAGAAELMDRALAIDPKFALAWWGKGTTMEDRADLDGALAAYARCLDVSSAAASCLRSRAMIHAQRGACAELEADARRMIVIEPTGYRPFEFLARALFARGRPIETVREALRQKWQLYPAERRATRELYDRAQLDLATGDFASAERRARELEQLVAGAPTDLEHAEAASQLVDVYEETGRTAMAADVADAFLKRADAWVAVSPIGESPVQAVVPRMLAASARAGRITRAELDTRRAAWLAAAQAKVSPLWAKELWFTAYAAIADDADSARAALAALPRFSPLPPGRDFTMADASTGKVYLLAGDIDAALPRLERGASTCLALDAPVVDTRAHLDLGDALARARAADPADPAPSRRACAAYRAILDRWGTAKPRSITAEAARARIASLHCEH